MSWSISSNNVVLSYVLFVKRSWVEYEDGSLLLGGNGSRFVLYVLGLSRRMGLFEEGRDLFDM